MIWKDMWLRLCSVSLATLLLAHTAATQTTLFSFNEPITQLSVSNFSSVISNSPKLWVVDFYAAWCGYCKRMAPEFSAVAQNIRGWSDVVGMAAIACSEPINSPLCRSYHITGYPVIKFFPPNSGSTSRGHKYEGDKLAAGLLTGIIQYLNQLVNEGRVDRSWPKLKSVEHPQELRQSNGTRQVFIVVEDNSMSNKHVGLMVILDSLQMRPDVAVGRMSSRDATRYGVSSPGLFRATSFGGLQEISRETNREPISRSIIEAAGRGRAVMEAGILVVTTAAAPKAYDFTPSNGLHMQDLESSLYYSLWVEIPSRVSFDSESLNALKRYINILAKFHPGEAHVRNFLTALNDWLSNQRPPLSSISWLQKLNSIQSKDANIHESLRWTGCNGSLPSLRGYPCSLWMTFHAITVSAYVREIANMSFDARDILVPISDYIRHFFSCRECAHNFRSRAGDLATRSFEPRDVVLWLWKMHNRANLHLHGDASEDPRHPKVQFPSHRACPSCRVEAAANLRFNVSDNAWREDRVLTYLLHYYGKEHIVDDDTDEETSSVTRRQHSQGGGSSSGGHVTGSPAASSSCPSPGSSDWTPCSRTCDVGISVRMTQSVTSGCRLVPEVRLCLMRLCTTQFPNWTRSPWHESNCAKYGHTYRLTKPLAMSYGNCSLTESESWRVCGLCPPSSNRAVCCRPLRSGTQLRETACMVRSEGGQVHRVLGSIPVEVIDFCTCDHSCG